MPEILELMAAMGMDYSQEFFAAHGYEPASLPKVEIRVYWPGENVTEVEVLEVH